MYAPHALDDLSDEAVEIDDLEGEAVGLELAARHVPQDVTAAIELLDRGLQVGVVLERVGATDPGEPQLRGVEGRRELVGEAGGEGTDRAQAIDPRLALLGLGEPDLQVVEGRGQPGGQDPEHQGNDDLSREEDVRREERGGEARRDVAVELDHA